MAIYMRKILNIKNWIALFAITEKQTNICAMLLHYIQLKVFDINSLKLIIQKNAWAKPWRNNHLRKHMSLYFCKLTESLTPLYILYCLLHLWFKKKCMIPLLLSNKLVHVYCVYWKKKLCKKVLSEIIICEYIFNFDYNFFFSTTSSLIL